MKRTLPLIATALLLTGAAATQSKLTQRQRAQHALDRLSFGARPGDVDRVLSMGVDRWIDQQLHPERIADRAVDARLAQYASMSMSNGEIIEKYYAPVLEARKEAKKNGEGKDAIKEMEKDIPYDQRPRRVVEELASQRIIRAVDSERQLNEVMVDFWMNHFNVFAGKGIDRFLLTSYERDTIRPRVWGKFEDLLMATAKSPAMLFYLDNARSVADPEHRPAMAYGRIGRFGQLRPRGNGQNQGGINENYAREIMELHTLGVDGGYTQKDVTELARVFTGWSIARPNEAGAGTFVFRRQLHDAGAKTVLGVRFGPGGGIEEGERMIHLLAHHPSTAHHIAYKLCERLTGDDPPKALVDRVAARFLATDGDLRQTVKAVIDSPEFWDARYYRAKVKSPFEYVISAVRAVNGQVDDPLPIAKALMQIGEPLYGAQPPTGYSEKSAAWINTGALMNRLNFALALAGNKLPGVRSDVPSLVPAETNADESLDALAQALTGGSLTAETTETIRSRGAADVRVIAALILGSPEFQRQ